MAPFDYEYTSPEIHDNQGFEAVRPTTGSLLKHFFAVRTHQTLQGTCYLIRTRTLCLFETTYVFLMLLHLRQTGYVSKHPTVGQDCWGDESLLTLADDRKPWNTSHFRPFLHPYYSKDCHRGVYQIRSTH